jgi:hypothetical protein
MKTFLLATTVLLAISGNVALADEHHPTAAEQQKAIDAKKDAATKASDIKEDAAKKAADVKEIAARKARDLKEDEQRKARDLWRSQHKDDTDADDDTVDRHRHYRKE